MWVLLMNDMRERTENLKAVARAHTCEALRAFLREERVEPYTDTSDHNQLHDTDYAAQVNGPHIVNTKMYEWRRYYRADGPLYWYNEPFDDTECFREVSTREEWAEKAKADWDRKIGHLPLLGL